MSFALPQIFTKSLSGSSVCDAKNVASSGKKPCPGVPEQIFPDLVRSKSVPGP